MRKGPSFILLFYLLQACSSGDEPSEAVWSAPKVTKATGYLVPADSMSTPLNITLNERKLTRVLAGKPTIVNRPGNSRLAGIPSKVKAGIPLIYTPGNEDFSLPQTVPALDRPFTAGISEVVVAKGATSKDSNPYSFSSFNKLQGLKDNFVSSILEDRAGNLWFGTFNAGVSRYDGRSFTHFTENEGLSNNNVFCLFEDRSGNIWMGTWGGGITRYDGKSFTHFTTREGLSNDIVLSILEDRHGNLWFGTYGGGVNKFDGKSFVHYTKAEGLSSNEVTSILEDRSGALWFGTNGGGVSKFDGTSFAHFTRKEGLSNDVIQCMVEDQYGNLWFGTNGGGVCKFDGQYFTHLTEKEGLSGSVIWSMAEARNGSLWFGTNGQGVCSYDGKSITDFTEQDGLSNNVIRSVLEDRFGNLWFGTNGGGVTKYNSRSFTHLAQKEGLSGNKVLSIAADRKGDLWIGTLGGLSRYDRQSRISRFTVKEGLSSDDVTCTLEDRSGNIWIGTWGRGITKYVPSVNGGDGSFIYFTQKDGLPNDYILSMVEDHAGNLWIGTSGGGVCKYDGRSFTHLTEKEGLSNNIVWCMLEDHLGNLWFGTRGGGVTRYTPPVAGVAASITQYKVDDGLANNEVWGMMEDQYGNLWFGTNGGGVDRFDGQSFMHFTEKEGLVSNIVWGVLEDHSGNLWFSTQVGLSELLWEQNKKFQESNNNYHADRRESDLYFRNYTYADGFLGVGCDALYEDNEGTLWIGADDRLTIFHPPSEDAFTDTLAPNMQITAIQLFSENMAWVELEKRKDSTFVLGNGVEVGQFVFDKTSRWYGLPEHLTLRHDNNYLTFNFIGITLRSPAKVKYQYMLDGLDKSWSTITSRTEAPYGNLPPGDYNFKVKAMNGQGDWSRVVAYAFSIRPPWWQTLWAYTLYAILFAGGAYSAYRFQRARIIRKEREGMQQKELEQAREIEKAYTNLKITQAQLIQSEKMASLGVLTAGIAHEIQNPLNFVNNFSEVNIELLEELQQAQEKDLRDIKSEDHLLNTVRENEQKINHHGRRADAIVKGMLQHSRVSTGVKERADPNAIADEYIKLAYHGLRARDKSFNATIITDFDPAIGLIRIVPQDIGRVIMNLMNNAFYAVSEKKIEWERRSPSGGSPYEPTVSLTTKRDGDKIFITVVDNGTGIPEGVRDKIFQPFFTTKPTGQGTGLGLSLSYDIVKAHGGELKAETKEAEGTVFTVVLPV